MGLFSLISFEIFGFPKSVPHIEKWCRGPRKLSEHYRRSSDPSSLPRHLKKKKKRWLGHFNTLGAERFLAFFAHFFTDFYLKLLVMILQVKTYTLQCVLTNPLVTVLNLQRDRDVIATIVCTYNCGLNLNVYRSAIVLDRQHRAPVQC